MDDAARDLTHLRTASVSPRLNFNLLRVIFGRALTLAVHKYPTNFECPPNVQLTLMKTPLFLALGLLTGCGAHAQTAPLRTLIISGGPDFEYNQYAIESNARYVEGLTDKSSWRRVYFADGAPNSRTISAYENSPAFRAKRALAWILDEQLPEDKIVAQASTLKNIDGASTKPSVTRVFREFVSPTPDERGFLYFTGHGNAGGTNFRPDYDDTTFALWNNGNISAREVGRAVQNWPAKNPLFIVMVQCHSGGFANLIFQDGDPKKPLVDRDIAGFFSSTGQRPAAGCTSEVNERDYQDFTTHFFAALSGVSRDGRKVSGADYDRNGAVSGSEAFAWANLNDLSIDVPVTTSDAYLRSIFPVQSKNWQNVPYSQITADASAWQIAMLGGLSSSLNLKGEARVAAAMAQHRTVRQRNNSDENVPAPNVDETKLNQKMSALKSQMFARFPALKSSPKSNAYRTARAQAQTWLQARPADVAYLDDALAKYSRAQSNSEAREAMLERFVRTAYTIHLQNRVRDEGTPAQKMALAKLRTAEGRNPLK